MPSIALRAGLFGIVASVACASGAGNVPRPSAAAPVTRIDEPIRSLAIVPSISKACPGGSIPVRYEATTSSGKRVTLTGSNLQLIERSGSGVTARDDGGWVADANPLMSAATGFHLHAALKSDSTIRADTVVVPTYGCDKRQIVVPTAYIRVGVLRSPFYDSIAVAAVEVERGTLQIIVLEPNDMKGGVIRVDAAGKNGAPGRRGRNGGNGASCEAGSPGDDGEDGSPGENGGRVDLIVQTDAPWVANLISISNAGGRGGAGGAGGSGGQSGGAGSGGGRTRGASCSTAAGRPGRPGRPGVNGTPGPASKISTVPLPLLWSGSPLWTNQDYRAVLEQLIELTQR